MGVFAPRAGGWGLVFTLLVCSPFGVCVFWVLARLLGVVGQCGPAAPCPGLLACSRSGVGGFDVCAVLCTRWAEGGNVGAGHDCPAPCSVALGCLWSPRGAEREREVWRVGCSHGVLTRAERWERRGSHVGRTVVAWAGVVGGGALGGNTRWWRQVPKAEGEQN